MSTAPTRVALIGAGSVGSFFAAHLAAKGERDGGIEVTVCARRPFTGLVVESDKAPVSTNPPVLLDPADLDGPFDWVLLGVKAHQTEGARGWLDAACGPASRVVTLQNGLDPEPRVRPFVGAAEIVPSVVYCGAELLEPGRIHHRNHGFLIVPAGPAADDLVELFEGTPAGIRPDHDFPAAQWQKLTSNVVANGITALTGRRFEVFGLPGIQELAATLARECIAVAGAEGAAVDEAYADLLVSGIQLIDPTSGTSMLYDREAGRPLEHEAIHGAVVEAAARHGIDVPMVRAVTGLLDAVSTAPPA